MLGCSCEEPATSDRYMTSDFIGVVEIQQTKDTNFDKERFYLADLNAITTYKGVAPSQIRVSGTTQEVYSGECEISIKTGERWLVYLQKDKDGHFYLSHCSNPLQISDSTGNKLPLSDKESRDFKQLNFLKTNVPNLHSEEIISADFYELWTFLKQYQGKSLNQSTAYFLVNFSKSLEVLDIKTLQGFSKQIDNQLVDFLKNEAEWHTGIIDRGSRINHKTEYVISVHYYQKDKSLSPADM